MSGQQHTNNTVTSFVLATLQTTEGPSVAIGIKDVFYPLYTLGPEFRSATVKTLLEDWDFAFRKLGELADEIRNDPSIRQFALNGENATFLTPVLYPDKLLAVGANYADHLREMGLVPDKWESMPFFMRPPTTSLVGPGETVEIPKPTKQFDWEIELAVVVGKTLRHASIDEAAGAIAGYTIGLDLSCRDLIQTTNELKIDLIRGKAQDTMAPCGPFMVPAQFVDNVNSLGLKLSVNGRQMMNSSTKEMLYKCDEMLSIISSYITLSPGDIVFTGSPPGSAGVHGNCWLQPGDLIRAEIDGLGVLEVRMKPT